MAEQTKPVGWEIFLPMVAQYGVPWAYSVWQIVTEHKEPSEEAWEKLLELSGKPMLDYINVARAKIGLAPIAIYDPRADAGAASRP